jgi:hypothetical protein
MSYLVHTTPDPASVPAEERRLATLERIAELASHYCDKNSTKHDLVLRELEQCVRDLERR